MAQITYKDTLVSILNTMDSIRDGGTVNPFNTIAIWNDQIKRLKNGTGYSFLSPAIFLESKQINHERLGMGYKAYDLDITIHLLDEQLDTAIYQYDGLNPNLVQLDQNLEVFHLRDLVIQYLDGCKPVQMGNLWYIDDIQDFSHDNCYHFQIKFKGRVVDQIANTMPATQSYGVTYSISYEYIWKSGNQGATANGSTFSLP